VIAEHPSVLEAESPPAREDNEPMAVGVHRTKDRIGRFDNQVFGESKAPNAAVVSTRFEFEKDADHCDMMRLIAGYDQALESLMHRHAHALYSQLERALRNRADIQDALQETFVRVYLHRESFDFQRKFSTWLYVIAFNLARDELRRRARRPEFASLDDPAEGNELAETLVDTEPSPDRWLDKQERFDSLSKAVDALPEGLRQPLILFSFEEKSQPEIAGEMHCSTKAVEMRLYHARKQLHIWLEENSKDGEGFCGGSRSNSQTVNKRKL
jgi:RNA polymerase sigma-70 factor (ECF subfamily)